MQIRNILAGSILGLSLVMGAAVPLVNYQIDNNMTQKQRVETIFENILKTTGQNFYAKLDLINDDTVNAWTDGTTITVTTGLLSHLHNNDEIAMIIGHEMSHITLKHNTVDDSIISQVIKESQADKLGQWYMMRAGYNPCRGVQVFRMLNNLFGDAPDGDHPANAYRISQLSLPWCPQWQ